MITFVNPGEIDIRLITTLGVNVKEGEGAIGFFGTGLKYAIAVLLREGQRITIHSGLHPFTFSLQPDTIRGKEFSFIKLSSPDREQLLGFTTELGKNWTLQHAYRELFSNAKDEGGEMLSGAIEPKEGHTTIEVEGEEFDQIHNTRDSFLLFPKSPPIYSDHNIEIYTGSSKSLFYRGIAAYSLDIPSFYTYNFLERMDLTEDRTFSSPWTANWRIRNTLTTIPLPSTDLSHLLTSSHFEKNLSFQDNSWSENFMEAARIAVTDFPTEVDGRLAKAFHTRKGDVKKLYIPLTLTPSQKQELARARAVLMRNGIALNKYEIFPVEDLGYGVVGLAAQGKIFLAKTAFTRDDLCEVLLEEFVHLEYGVNDETRAMQNILLKMVMKLVRGQQPVVSKVDAIGIINPSFPF